MSHLMTILCGSPRDILGTNIMASKQLDRAVKDALQGHTPRILGALFLVGMCGSVFVYLHGQINLEKASMAMNAEESLKPYVKDAPEPVKPEVKTTPDPHEILFEMDMSFGDRVNGLENESSCFG
eukprot:328466-Amorphochlora_amoeboformis.AAC.1